MTIATRLLGATVLTLLAATASTADQADMSTAIHDVILTGNIPDVTVTVRNMSASTDPAQRDLRAVSAAPQFHVTGQVWCKTLSNGPAHAVRAQLYLGNVSLHSTNEGVDASTLGSWGHSAPQAFSGTHEIENFELDLTAPMQTSWEGNAINLGFNPVRDVEERLEQYLAQNAGSAADFLRSDAVFETTIGVNAVGWCEYEGFNYSGTYAGYRRKDITVRIFYQGDSDIQDVPTAVGGANTVNAPAPARVRAVLSPQGAGSAPPARTAPPARATDNDPPPRRAPQR